MVARIVLGILWIIAVSALAGAIMLPKALDIYIRDRYFVIHRASVILGVLLLLVVPMLLLTILLFQVR